MTNKKFLYGKFTLWTIAIPLFVVIAFSTVFCLLEKNYYYLPYEADFLIDFTYNALYYFLYIVLFFTLGVLSVVSLTMKAKPIIITNIVSFICTFALFPFAAYAMRVIFLASTSGSEEMGEYLFSDFLCAAEDAARFIVAVAVIFAVKIFFSVKKISPEPQKPYVLPKSASQIALLIFYAAWILVALISFIVSEDHIVSSLLVEIGISVAGYFISVAGVVVAVKKLIKTE